VDLIGERNPFVKHASAVIRLAYEGKIKLYTSSHVYATTYYLLRKYSDDRRLKDNLMELLEVITIIPIDLGMIKKGLRSGDRDFEDSLQMQAAYSVSGIQYILTRDSRDYKNSDITAISAEEYLLREHKA
jgi:predicted nucleic acid-binding protein